MTSERKRRERFWWGLTANLPMAFIDIGESVVTIATLGYYTPSWSFSWIAWRTKLDCERRIAARDRALSPIDPEETDGK